MSQQLDQLNNEAFYDELSDRTARDNISIFLREAGLAEVFADLPPADRKLVIDVPLKLQLDKLSLPDSPQTERDEVVAFFEKQNWIPKDRAEAAAALPPSLHLARFDKPAVSFSPQGRTEAYKIAKARFIDAEDDERVFAKIGVQAERGRDDIVARWLRRSREGQYLIADGLMAREFLNTGDWPEEDSLVYYLSRSYWRGFMLMAAQYASDETLSDVLKYFFEKSQARRQFASRKYGAAAHWLGRRGVRAVNPGLGPQPKPEPAEISKSDEQKQASEEKYDASNARIANLSEQSSSFYAAAKREAGGGEPIIEDGKLIGAFPPEDQPSAEKLAKWEADRQARIEKRRRKRR